jgi:hypothetical protein
VTSSDAPQSRKSRTWLWFTLIRLGIFAVVLVALLYTMFPVWIDAIIAATVSLCISIIFLRNPRAAMSEDLYRLRTGQKIESSGPTDEDAEDAVIDSEVLDSEGESGR